MFIYLGIFFIIILLCADPPWDEMIPDGVRQGEVVIPRRRNIPVLHQGVMDMTVKGFLHFSHIFHSNDTPYRDLLALLGIWLNAHLDSSLS